MPRQLLDRAGVHRDELERKGGVGRHCLLRRQLDVQQVFSDPSELKTKSAFMRHCLLPRQIVVSGLCVHDPVFREVDWLQRRILGHGLFLRFPLSGPLCVRGFLRTAPPYDRALRLLCRLFV
jgi:hypothetical protein